MERHLLQRLDLSDVVEARCPGCPAILASEIGEAAVLANLRCENMFVAPIIKSDDVGCRKGNVAQDKLLYLAEPSRRAS